MSKKAELLSLRKEILNDEFSFLNPPQREAVFSNDGPLLILAGAGSGKTTTVISKIGYLIRYGNAYNSQKIDFEDDDGEFLKECLANKKMRAGERYFRLMSPSPVDAYNILAITFTNKAAGEMRERLEKQYSIDSGKLWALTFHSFCVRILRRFCDRLGYNRNFTIYDDTDSHRVIESLIKKYRLTERYNAKTVARIISTAKSRNTSADEYSGENDIEKIYRDYQAELKAANAFDFDDLIFMTVRLLSLDEDVKTIVNNRFRYILVDEYQDTNPIQERLISLLAPSGRICVVGDDDQSIYRFMGAQVENILNFEKRFRNAKTVRLEQNYRSTQTILDAANAVIANNEDRKGKRLWTDAGEGEKISVCHLQSQSEEGDFICRAITKRKEKEGLKNNDFCVLYRTNAQSGAIEHALRLHGISYRVFGGLPFFKRKEVQDILAYMNVICNPNDRTRLLRIINEPKRGIGDTTIEKINSICDKTGKSFFDITAHADSYAELQRSAEKLKDFAGIINELTEKSAKMRPSELCSEIISSIHYEYELKKQYETNEAISRIENVRELINSIAGYEETEENPTLLGYLEQTALVSATDSLDENEPAVTLMTMHCAKGLEFNTVFITGFEEGLFPSSISLLETGGVEEERRLCYVAITRAKKKLFITNVASRMIFGSARPAIPSRFLKEIPENLIEETETRRPERPAQRRTKPLSERPLLTNSVTVMPGSKAPTKKYRTGQRVRHKVFGDGVITAVTEMSSDSMLEVEFETVGKKKLMANYANLKEIL
ncbi:MAG: UvrD-helicase domain-containing protein [Clostridia bacterium]|nr:UvrD-helicase domain-containing protein [Clostridia bacterium]